MIYATPKLEGDDYGVIGLIDDLKNKLRFQVNSNPLRWQGFLRRNTFARALQGSNSIEGINASLSDAVAIVDEEKPETMEEETAQALMGYRSAMTYIVRAHDDPHTEINAQFIRSLHYMMLSYDMTKLPGQWRPGSIYVVHEPTGETVYEGPPSEKIPGYMLELIEQIKVGSGTHNSSIVTGAMAHLNLTMIHPFRDGNGRMARALQTLVLARDGLVGPVFCSIEEWLGRNTDSYYRILAETGEGKWNPRKNALPWVRFCLIAHYQQAATLMKRNAEIGRVWLELEKVRTELGMPARFESVLMDAAFGYKVKNQRYREEHSISDVVASRDLKKMSDAGLIDPVGEKRGRFYIGTKRLVEIRHKCADRTKAANPYDLLTKQRATSDQLRLAV